MTYTKTQQARLLARQCLKCGAARNHDGATKRWCASCAQKNRDYQQANRLKNPQARLKHAEKQTARRRERRASGLCINCCKPRTGHRPTSFRCGDCAEAQRKTQLAYQQRRRNKAAGYIPGDGRNVKKWNMGRGSTAKREGGAFYFQLVLDMGSRDAIQIIWKRYKDAERAAGRVPQTHQLSRIVREIIVRYEPNRVVLRPGRKRLPVEDKANLSLDGRTRAILERQANANFGGNKSAALRAMLIECQGFRRAFTGRG